MIHGMSNGATVAEQMRTDGWQDLGGMRWHKKFEAAESMVMPSAGPKQAVTRWVTRDASTRVLSEDLWLRSRTPSRLLTRSLKKRRGLDV